MFGAIKGLCTWVGDYFSNIFNHHPLTEINFDPQALCPSNIPAQEIQEWVNVYLRKLEQESLLLWANDHRQLMVSYSQEDQPIHICLENYTVDPSDKRISHDGTLVNSLNEIASAVHRIRNNTFSLDIQYPSLDTLQALKTKAYISRKLITEEVLKSLHDVNLRLIENYTISTQCSICTEDFNKEDPAITLVQTGHSYHNDCLQEHFSARRNSNLPLTDPMTNTVLRNTATAPAPVLMSLVADTEELFRALDAQIKIVGILREEIAELKAQLPNTSNSPVLVGHSSAGASSAMTPTATPNAKPKASLNMR